MKEYFLILSKKPLVWVIVGLILVCLLVLTNYYFRDSRGAVPVGEQKPENVINTDLPEGYQFEALEQGKYPEGFPQDLVVKDGEWQRAEDTLTGEGERQRIVELIYKNTNPAVLSDLFKSNFEKADWTVENLKIDTGLVVKNFTKDTDVVALTIVQNGEDSLVNITFKTY